ncbi:hypothetical protein F5879DRAFT_49384 [Lentinula edodes]|nr:hypothetical protein F5879DRAFT_49384 [Lentinula edodes]
MNGVVDLFWAPGNFELIVFAQPSLKSIDEQLFVINPPSRKAPQLANILLTTRDQPDISIINPESDVWQHIKVLQSYLAAKWPIRLQVLAQVDENYSPIQCKNRRFPFREDYCGFMIYWLCGWKYPKRIRIGFIPKS